MVNSWLCTLLVFLLWAGSSAGHAQAAERLSHVKKLYVDSLGTDNDALEMRKAMIRQLQKSRDVKVVADAKEADALVRGAGRIWTTGHISLSPRSHNSSQPVREGYLSVEVVGKNGETLWSYLVTPSKFPWHGITDDLAHQLVGKLLRAIKEEAQQEPSIASVEVKSEGTLRGAGATFPAPLYRQWFELFQEQHPGVHIGYEAVGSAEGIRLLQAGKVEFAASEMPLSDAAMSEARQRFLHLPEVLGAVVPIYNVKGLHQNLNFTPETLAGIFLGKIRKWNDPQIRMSNRGAALPDADVVVVHRSDGSGTSFVWTDYLSKISPEWKAAAGAGTTVHWPVGIEAEHNEGVASTVQLTANSIGYVEFIYAIQHELSFGAVKNAAGEFVRASISSVTAAAATNGPSLDLRASITNPSGKDAYPIATYTWLLLPEQMEDKNKKTLLFDLARWMLTSGQAKCSGLGYAPLPMEVARRALDSLDGK